MPAAAPAFTHSAPNWRRVAADGFIEIGGVYSGPLTTEGTATVTFATAFPNECLGISGVVINSGAGVSGNTQIQEVSLGAGSAVVFVQDQGSSFSEAAGGFRYRAWGR